MKNFIAKFEEIVKKYPDNVAILIDGEGQTTYTELAVAAKRVAWSLKSRDVKKGDLIAINLEKSFNYIATLLGIWYAGAAFLPLSPSLPKKRMEFILRESEPVLVIGGRAGGGIHNIQDFIERDNPGIKVPVSVASDDLAYVIYTSGSTGKPKGVMVNHSGIVNVLEQQIKMFKLNSSSRSIFILSINFDASISDIGTALLSGATLCMETAGSLEVASNLPEIISKRKITYIDLPPSLLRVLNPGQMPHTLKSVVIGGEAVSAYLVRKWSKKFRLVNVYGPTEATICTSMVVCNPDDWDEPDIGRPIHNIGYKILNGELLIAGIGLARGYLKRAELNKNNFIYINGRRYYRTGDMVKKSKGKIYFIGRKDRQVKIRGQLIAPEEVEMQLQSFANVVRAAVTVYKDKLISFIEFKGVAGKNVINKLKKHLEKSLPAWMIPGQIIPLKRMPLNSSGKIDYGQLLKIGIRKKTALNASGGKFSDKVMRHLREIWGKVLSREDIGFNENFFSIGGDSLAALQIVTEAKKYGINIPIGLLPEKPTIRALAKWHQDNKNKVISDARPADEFKKDILIGGKWKAIFRTGRLLPNKKGEIFLTGATGFLGIHLIRELLKNTNRDIYVLVRAPDLKKAMMRVIENGKRYEITFNPKELRRINAVLGDVTRPYLGMSKTDWQRLSKKISDVYHCAASVNMVKTYEELRPANVDSVKEIVRFGLTGNKKKINYASSLSVFVATDKNSGLLLEKDNLSGIKKIYGGYAQSKWVTERFLQKIPDRAIDINIFRFGLITGDSKNGIYSDHDYLEMFVRGIIGLGAVPAGRHSNITLDVTPIDYAAKAMAYIGLNSLHGTYHIANKQGFSLKMILEVLRKLGIKMKTFSPKNWVSEIRRRILNQSESAAFMALCRLMPGKKNFEQLRSMDLFQATNAAFDETNAKIYLGPAKISAPEPDYSLLEKYIKRIIKS